MSVISEDHNIQNEWRFLSPSESRFIKRKEGKTIQVRLFIIGVHSSTIYLLMV